MSGFSGSTPVDDFGYVLRGLAQTVLIAANTLAGNRVETSRVEQVEPGDTPRIVIYQPSIDEEWLGNAPPTFRANYTLMIEAVADGAQRDVVEATIYRLVQQIKNALLTSQQFMAAPMEKIFSINTKQALMANGDRFSGGGSVTLVCQTSEQYLPLLGVSPAVNANGVGTAFTTLDLETDAIQPFDPNGTYNPAYPAPRVEGPDGRIEIGANIAIPN